MIIPSKLRLTNLPREMVERKSLGIGHLAETSLLDLVSVTAPTGYGKTILLHQWKEAYTSKGVKCCWINLDNSDNDPVIFISYLCAALKEIYADIEKDILPLQEIEDCNTALPLILTSIINKLETVQSQFVIFFDNYHNITEDVIHDSINWLLSHKPENMIMIIASRSKLSLSFDKFNNIGQALEFTTNELKFNEKDTAILLNDINNLDLDEVSIKKLCDCMEGWVAGIKIALFAMQELNSDDRQHFIEKFNGTDEVLASYLESKLLNTLSADKRSFLLKTSILNRVNAEVCHDLTDSEYSPGLFEQIKNDDLFLLSIDRNGYWHRYPSFFQTFLQLRLRLEFPGLFEKSHLKAAKWFAKYNFYDDAIHHGFLSSDLKLTAEYIEYYINEHKGQDCDFKKLVSWASKLPIDILNEKADIWFMYILYLPMISKRDKASNELIELMGYYEAELQKNNDITSAEIGKVKSAVTAIECNLQTLFDNTKGLEQKATNALKRVNKSSQADRISFYMTLAHLNLHKFDFDMGLRAIQKGAVLAEESDDYLSIVVFERILGTFHQYRCNYREAEHHYNNSIDKANLFFGIYSPGAIGTSLVLSTLLYNQNRIMEATQALENGFPNIDRYTVDTISAGYQTQSMLQRLQGDAYAANNNLVHAENLGYSLNLPRLSLFMIAEQIFHLLYTGDIEKAVYKANEKGIFESDNSFFEDKRLVVTNVLDLIRIKIFIATGKPYKANTVLLRLILKAKNNRYFLWLTRLYILHAKTMWLMDDKLKAIRSLMKAIEITGTEDIYRPYIDEGPIVGEILKKYLDNRKNLKAINITNTYIDNYLATLSNYFNIDHINASNTNDRLIITTDNSRFKLTKRELEIVKNLDNGLSNKEISAFLSVSEGTVKWHLQNVYDKLSTRTRCSTVAKARKLALI